MYILYIHMKIVGVIPVKLNSKRLPMKNIKLLNNKPLCQYLFDTVENIKEFDEIYCYCSSNEIEDYLPSKITYLKRDKSLDSDNTSMNDILKKFMSEINSDIYVLLHVTAPFIKKKTIINCIDKVKNYNFDSSFSATEIRGFLWKDNKSINFDPSNIPRTQDLDPIYEETSGIYVFKKDIFLNHNRRVGFNPYIHLVKFKESIDIDTIDDFKLAEYFGNINFL
jgi:CMP-N-acetylneuraminic acid synthetase